MVTEIPTISLEHLTDAQAKAYMIADNRLTEISEWDETLLAEQLKELSALSLDFSMETIGFSMGEIDLRIESLNNPSAKDDPADALPPTSSVPVSHLHDLWLLGGHRIYCGNALEPESYVTLLAGKAASMIFTDPPYNVKIAGHVSGRGTIQHREFAMASGELSSPEFRDFLAAVCEHLATHSLDGALHYVCMDWRHIEELMEAGRAAYDDLKNICVWVKTNAGMGSFYRSQHELIFVFKKGSAPHRNNVQLGRFGRNRTNVWHYPGTAGFAREDGEGYLSTVHPTIKPVALIADAIMDASARNDIILDAFLGSGSTLVAAERTGRRCFGIEIDPLYVDTAIRRWQQLSGRKAIHATTHRSFDELAAAAEASQ